MWWFGLSKVVFCSLALAGTDVWIVFVCMLVAGRKRPMLVVCHQPFVGIRNSVLCHLSCLCTCLFASRGCSVTGQKKVRVDAQ